MPLSTISLKMKRITSLDVLGNPETIAVFKNEDKSISCLTPASEAGLNEAILSTLLKSDLTVFPSGKMEVRSDGSLFVEGAFFAPEVYDEALFGLRKKYDTANGISPSDRVLLPGQLKREAFKYGYVIS